MVRVENQMDLRTAKPKRPSPAGPVSRAPSACIRLAAAAAAAAFFLLPAGAGASPPASDLLPDSGRLVPCLADSRSRAGEKARSLLTRTLWSAWGAFDLSVPASARADMGLCAGFSAGVIAQADLLPGKEFPFAAVVPLSLDLKFGSGKDRYMSSSGWADTRVSAMVLAFKADFGVDLFWENEKLLVFPFAGIGMGVESTGGDHITYDGNRFVFTMQAGAFFAIFIGKSVYATGSFKFCANMGAANIKSTAAIEAGLGFKIG